jgi:hypothetical protein
LSGFANFVSLLGTPETDKQASPTLARAKREGRPMTEAEAEWLFDTGGRQLRNIEAFASVRKLLLIAAAYVRRAQQCTTDNDDCKSCDSMIEAVADCPRPWSTIHDDLAVQPGSSWRYAHILAREGHRDIAMELRKLAAFHDIGPGPTLTDLIHDTIGNPFRPLIFEPSWLTPTVLALGVIIYAERAFDRLPILADALEDAGCTDTTILDHLRGPGPHSRGCFALDLVLGKS